MSMTDSSQRIRFGLEWLGDLELAERDARWQIAPGRWEVQVHIERFVEPTLLLLLSERPRHGYEWVTRSPGSPGDHTSVDIGNLYRVLPGTRVRGYSSPPSGSPSPPALHDGPTTSAQQAPGRRPPGRAPWKKPRPHWQPFSLATTQPAGTYRPPVRAPPEAVGIARSQGASSPRRGARRVIA